MLNITIQVELKIVYHIKAFMQVKFNKKMPIPNRFYRVITDTFNTHLDTVNLNKNIKKTLNCSVFYI